MRFADDFEHYGNLVAGTARRCPQQIIKKCD